MRRKSSSSRPLGKQSEAGFGRVHRVCCAVQQADAQRGFQRRDLFE